MAAGRWYPSVTPLRNGEMLITEGGPDTPEVRKTDGGLRALTAASLNLPLYPWIDVAPDGRAFYSGPDQTMRSLDTAGGGSWQSFGQRDALNRDYGSHAFFDVGKILIAGGSSSSRDARVINLNGATPQVSATAPMAYGRRQHNLTVLADGTVLATGGNSSGAELVDLDHGVYPAELWNPATGQWQTLAAMQVTRQYHSTALLLPDGRVLSAGGGICGTCDQVGYLAKNAEVFSPPYLFKKDGSGELAPRPEITSAPDDMTYNAPFAFSVPNAASIRKVALVRLGAVTHSVNMEQRYVPLSFTADGEVINATAPANANVAPPGIYMLFVINANGVPSVARMMRVGNEPTTAITGGPNARTNDPTPTFTFSSQPGTSFECRLDSGSYVPCGSPKTTSHLADGSHTFSVRARDAAGNVDPTPGLPHLHGQDRRGQRLGLDPHGHGGGGGQGQPGDHPSLLLDPAGHRPRRRRLHGLGRPHGRGMHPKRRLHRELQRRRDHADPGRLRGSDRQGGQLDDDQELDQRGSGERRLDRRLGRRHPDRGDGRRRVQGDGRKRSALRPRSHLRHDDQLRRRERPGAADKADLDLLPKDPDSAVTGCETKTRH